MQKCVFADTQYWIGSINPGDQWASRVAEVARTMRGVTIVTTDEVLIETTNGLCGSGTHARQMVVTAIRSIRANPRFAVVIQSRETFDAGLSFFEQRGDKSYSLTDCISMVTMRERGITKVLTHDHHFRQEGFVTLL